MNSVTWRLSLATIGLAAALLFVPFMLVVACAQQADRPAAGTGQNAAGTGQDNEDAGQLAQQSAPARRQLPKSGVTKAARRLDDPDARPWQPGPVPQTIPIDVAGMARDEAGKVVAGAIMTLYSITDKGSKAVGTATAGQDGRYRIRNAMLPVATSFGGHRFPKEITPYAGFIVCGLTPTLGIAWSPQRSMYALKEPHPEDIQGRLPFGQPVTLDLTFPKAAALRGKVIDETGRPVEGAKLQVLDADLLDDGGRETNNRQGYDWKALPGSVGRAVTARDGSFRIEGLADRACFWISVSRPETDNASLGFYAATLSGPGTVHEQLPPEAFNGRGRHNVKTSPISIIFPRIRPIAVTVVADDTGKSIAGAGVFTRGESLAAGVSSGGTTDAEGKVRLGLPPGGYKAIVSDPPRQTYYIRTEQQPLVVEPGEAAQPYEIRQKAGAELIIQAVEFRTNEPVVDAVFWQAPDDQPQATQQIQTSTTWSSEPWTNEKGELRAVLPPEPGRLYRFRFAGLREPNQPWGVNPDSPNTHGYATFPTKSMPVELIGGKTIRLRFIFHKTN